uniref:Pentatricopeptide repeat-containing protein-mitochondrial domain-containing protein n=1 Tax=Manihot esculenta TaxID=3983 RepID=A0A2C9V390_MANES
MAFSRITKHPQQLCKTISPINPNSVSIRNLSTDPEDFTGTINYFISIFTKQPFCPDSPELKSLAPMLNPRVVEYVLNSFKSWRIAYSFFNWASNQYGYKHNIYTYNAMASILSHARENAPLRALSSAILNSRCSMTPGALGFFIRCLGSVGLADEANVLFDQVKMMGLCMPNSYSYNCLLEAISRSKCRSTSVILVETRLQEMRNQGWEFDKYTLTPVLQVYCNAGKFNEALGVFNKICDRGWVDEHILSILVLCFSKCSEVDKAFELIEKMEDQNVRLNEKTFCILIHGFVKLSRVDKALQLFDKMQKYGFTPDLALFDVLIGGLCKSNELEKALSLYAQMKLFKILPDVGIFTKLISSFSEEGELTYVLDKIHEDMDLEGLTMLCNSCLNSLVNSGLIDKAHCLLQGMMGKAYGDNVELHKLFQDKKALVPAGKLDLALSLFQDMAQIGCSRNLVIYNNLIDGLCKSDRLEESYEILREMKESGIEPTQFTHNAMFGCLCRRGDASGALDLVKKMRIHGHEPWIKHYTFLVRKMCKNGKATQACKFLADMVQEGFLPDIIAYSASLSGLIEIQEVDQALKLFRDICARGHCPDVVAYNILISGLFKTQRITEAHTIFEEMVMKGLVPSVVTYNLLIDGWCKSGCIDEALHCLSRMSANEREPNVITYTTLIGGLCNAGRPDDAVMLWTEMRRRGCTPNRVAFMAFIHGLCQCGRPNAALVHLREMEDNEMEPDSFIYVALVSAFLADVKLPLAFEVLKEMVDKGKFPDLLDKNYIIVRDAILKLSKDARTSSSVRSLISNGSIPSITL